LLRLLRLDRYLGLPGAEPGPPEDGETVRFLRAGPRLQVVLPSEFAGGMVARLRDDFLRSWNEGGIREVVVDASSTRFIDGRGGRFLLAAQRLVERERGRTLWLLGLPREELQRMRREGLQSVRVDRRRRFRLDEPARRTE
jgi:anti-anti-sigma regulatory factor